LKTRKKLVPLNLKFIPNFLFFKSTIIEDELFQFKKFQQKGRVLFQ